MKRIIINFFTRDTKVARFFLASLIIYLLLNFLPHIASDSVRASLSWKSLIKICYGIVKELCAALTTSTFFYMVFEAWQESSKIKNELIYIVYGYEQMKYNVLREMILSEHNYLTPQDFEALIEKNCFNPKEAQRYLSKDKLNSIVFDFLDDRSLRFIIRELQIFLDKMHNLNQEFIRGGCPFLQKDFVFIDDLKTEIDGWLELGEIALSWTENDTPKCYSRLYLLFCQGDGDKDPIHENLLKILERYN